MTVTAEMVRQAEKNVRNRGFDKGWEAHAEYLRDRHKLGYVAHGWKLLGIMLMLAGLMLAVDMPLLYFTLPGGDAVYTVKLVIAGVTMILVGILPYRRSLRLYRAAKAAFVEKWGQEPW